MKIKPTARLSFPLASAIAAMLAAPSALAAEFWWDGGTANWNTTNEWSSDAAGTDTAAIPGINDDPFFMRLRVSQTRLKTQPNPTTTMRTTIPTSSPLVLSVAGILLAAGPLRADLLLFADHFNRPNSSTTIGTGLAAVCLALTESPTDFVRAQTTP